MDELEIPEENNKDKLYNLVRGGLGAIPFVGSIASETFGLILAAPISKRRNMWMEAVVEKLSEIENEQSGFINTLKENDEFISFLLESSQIAFKTHQQEKLEILKNTIKNFFLDNTVEYDRKYSFLKVIDEISPTHLKILYFIAKYEDYIIENITSYPQLIVKYNEIDEIDNFYFRKCVVDLENQSLIRVSKDFADFYGGGGFATDEGAPSIKVLDFGLQFIEFIKQK